MRELALFLALVTQFPAPPMVPPPPKSVPRAEATLLGYRLLDIRPDGAHFLGSTCPVSGFQAYTAAHVIKEVKGQLIALPNHGYQGDGSVAIRVRILWQDEKRDVAKIAVESPADQFRTWYPRGPVPVAGAEVRGILVLPGPSFLAVPSFGTYYGENDGLLWSSNISGPGASGSCLLDDQDRVFAILVAIASWGNLGDSPANQPRAAVGTPVPDK